MLMLVTLWCLSLRPPPAVVELGDAPTPPSMTRAQPQISLIPQTTTPRLTSIMYWHSRNGLRFTTKRRRYHILLGLLLIGRVECNPGPRTPKYPCDECSKAVRWGKSIACGTCSTWYHKSCLQITSANFETHKNLSWYCHSCALPNTSSPFDSFLSTASSPGEPTPVLASPTDSAQKFCSGSQIPSDKLRQHTSKERWTPRDIT